MNTSHHGFSQRDWLALSLLPSIGAKASRKFMDLPLRLEFF